MQKKQNGGVLHITTTSKGYLREPSTLIHKLDPTVGTRNFGIPHIGSGSWRVDMANSNQPTSLPSLDDTEEGRRRMLVRETLGHDQTDGWRLWPSRQNVSDGAVQRLRSLKVEPSP